MHKKVEFQMNSFYRKSNVQKTSIRKFEQYLLFAMFLCEFIPNLASINTFQWSVFGLVTLTVCYKFNARSRNIFQYSFWYSVFILYSLMTTLWAINSGLIVSRLIEQIKLVVLFMFVCSLIFDEKDFFRVIHLYEGAAAVAAIFIITVFNPNNTINDRAMISMAGTLWNLNFISNLMVVSFILSLVDYGRNRKIFHLFKAMVFVTVILLTGSRQGFLCSAVGFMLFAYLRSNKHRLRRLLLVGMSLMGIYILMVNIPFLYEVAGARIQSLFRGSIEVDSVMQSDSARLKMIRSGFEWFANNPFLGYGMNNYRELYSIEFGNARYAHNNYIEILVGGGLIGLCIYYNYHVRVLYRAITLYSQKHMYLTATVITLVITTLLSDVMIVSTTLFPAQFALCMSSVANRLCIANSLNNDIRRV